MSKPTRFNGPLLFLVAFALIGAYGAINLIAALLHAAAELTVRP